MLDLFLRALEKFRVALRPVAPLHAFGNALAQKTHHRFVLGHGIARELVAQIAELKAESRRKLDSVANAVGGDERQLERARNADRGLIPPLLFALAMSLQFDVNIIAAKNARELLNHIAPCIFSAAHQRCCERALVATGQADEACCVLLKIVAVRGAILLGCFAHLELRNELAEILIPGARFGEQGNARRLGVRLVRQPGRRRKPRPQ